MRLTWRDAVATLLFAAIVIPYAAYLYFGGFSLIKDSAGNTTLGILDPTGMAGLGLILGIIAAAVGGWVTLAERFAIRVTTWVVGAVSAILGVLALVGENLFNNATTWEWVLGGFIASIVVLWGLALARHAGIAAGERPHVAGMTAA